MTKIYYFSSIIGLRLQFMAQNLWNFLSGESIKVSLVTKWGDFWKAGCWLPGEPTLWSEGWNSQSHPAPCPYLLTSRVGRGTGNLINRQWPVTWSIMPIEWNLHKTPKGGGSKSFWAGEHVEIWGEWHSQRRHKSLPFPHTLLHESLPSGYTWVISFCNKLVIQ